MECVYYYLKFIIVMYYYYSKIQKNNIMLFIKYNKVRIVMSKSFLKNEDLNNLINSVVVKYYVIMERTSDLQIIPSSKFKYERYDTIEAAYEALRIYGDLSSHYTIIEFASVNGYK